MIKKSRNGILLMIIAAALISGCTENTPAVTQKTETPVIYELAETIELGTSGYTLSIPEGYENMGSSDNKFASYKSTTSQNTIDLYQYKKNDRSLKDLESAFETEGLNVDETTINTIAMLEIVTDDPSYSETYVFEAENDFVEIDFIAESSKDNELFYQIMTSLSKTSVPIGANTDIQASVQDSIDRAKKLSAEDDVVFEEKETSENVQLSDEGIFTTRNGVRCDNIKINAIKDDESTINLTDGKRSDRYEFVVELYNTTDQPQNFDTTLFVIKRENGQYIDPCAMSRGTGMTVRVEGNKSTCSTDIILNSKDMECGEKVYIYYDGVYVSDIVTQEAEW